MTTNKQLENRSEKKDETAEVHPARLTVEVPRALEAGDAADPRAPRCCCRPQ